MIVKFTRGLVGLCLGFLFLSPLGAPGDPERVAPLAPRALVIGHRGASGYRPDHTLESYRLAVEQGADVVEPDLCITKDGVLIARHENDISDTTDISKHSEFASRKTTKTIDGKAITGWFCEDFSLAELKTLRCRGRSRESKRYDDLYPMVTFQEMIDFVRKLEKEKGRSIAIYPETKHPSYFRRIGLPLEDRMLDILVKNGYQGKSAACLIQSFEVANLKALRPRTKICLMQLIDAQGAPQDFVESGDKRTFADMITPGGLAEIAKYADGVAVNKKLMIPLTADSHLGQPTSLIKDAHKAGLLVHGWTYRAENQFLPVEFRRGDDPQGLGDLAGETRRFFDAGIDGVFCNHPDQGVAGRR